MPTCEICNKEFSNYIKIEGIRRNLSSRKYCLDCSPFGLHNTKVLGKEIKYLCKCGETDPTKFYGKKNRICGKCHTKYTTQRGREVKKFIVDQLGGKCILCGFDKYICSLDIHHKDPSLKSVNFRTIKGWSREKILKEIETCILLCSNCHNAFHAGYISYQDIE